MWLYKISAHKILALSEKVVHYKTFHLTLVNFNLSHSFQLFDYCEQK